MNEELKRIEHLLRISDAIIENPSLSVADFGVCRNPNSRELKYTSQGSEAARRKYPNIVRNTAAYVGTALIVKSAVLSGIGISGASTIIITAASAIGISFTGIGLLLVPVVIIIGYSVYKKKKKQKEEKERIYREIIRKQQAAINRLYEINRKLEEKTRNQNNKINELDEEIKRLKDMVANLEEIIRVLKEQIENFKRA